MSSRPTDASVSCVTGERARVLLDFISRLLAQANAVGVNRQRRTGRTYYSILLTIPPDVFSCVAINKSRMRSSREEKDSARERERERARGKVCVCVAQSQLHFSSSSLVNID